MSDVQYDLLVIGAGSGGVRASRVAASLGAKVAVIEKSALGGTCVNLGCVPKKLFVYAARYEDVAAKAAGFGWSIATPQFNWQVLRTNKDREIQRLNAVYQQLLTDSDVEIIQGEAVIESPNRVRVGDHSYHARHILIAVGGHPFVPEFAGSQHVFTSDDAFHLPELPRRIMIVGGGYIGIEFAGIFSGLGVETHLCHSRDKLIGGFDEDLRRVIGQEVARKGVHLHFNAYIERIEKINAQELAVFARDGRQWITEGVMYATGRRPNVSRLGLEHTAVALNDKGMVQVNDYFQTAEPSVYAVGDAVGHKALTPVALAEAEIAVRHMFGQHAAAIDYDLIPTAIFSQPPVATVGLTEAAARERYGEIDVYKTSFKPLQFALSDSTEKTFMKLLVDRRTDKVLGCHMVGPEAPEIMQGFAVALTVGATKAEFDRTLGIHPTLAEEFVLMRKPAEGGQ
jgi:glutathione reductase (NADPH)